MYVCTALKVWTRETEGRYHYTSSGIALRWTRSSDGGPKRCPGSGRRERDLDARASCRDVVDQCSSISLPIGLGCSFNERRHDTNQQATVHPSRPGHKLMAKSAQECWIKRRGRYGDHDVGSQLRRRRAVKLLARSRPFGQPLSLLSLRPECDGLGAGMAL